MKHIIITGFLWAFLSSYAHGQPFKRIIRMNATEDFPDLEREGMASNRKPYGPFHAEEDLQALAGDDLNYTFHMAAAEGSFPGEAGIYNVSLNTLTERDGECVYNVYVNDERVGLFQKNPPTHEFTAPATLIWTGIKIPAGAKIRVESNNWSNLQRHEDNFFEYARGRWTSVDFIPESLESPTPDQIGIFDGLDPGITSDRQEMAEYDVTEEAYYLMTDPGQTEERWRNGTYLWKNVNGDFELEAHVRLIGPGKRQKAGIVLTGDSGSGSAFLMIGIHPDGNVFYEVRDQDGPVLETDLFTVYGADMIELVKKEDVIILSAARTGEEYERRTLQAPDGRESMRIGIFLSNSDIASKSFARFERVRFFGSRDIE